MKLENKLKEFFGYDNFKKGQKEIIEKILERKDVLGILPTGGGKSICYQLPALLMEGTCIVISPLISLMKDQVDSLRSNGINAYFINSSVEFEKSREIFSKIKKEDVKILYISPERLENKFFREFVSGMKISFVAVDEAHCISQWGHDFRPSYKKIPSFYNCIRNEFAIASFTATATENVKNDIIKNLKLKDPFIRVTGFDRENLYYSTENPKDKFEFIIKEIKSNESGIIYCSTRKNVELVEKKLNKAGFKATKYHAGLNDSQKNKNQEDFLFDRKNIMVATNAFGMGIDKSNVRFVIHYNMPKSMEEYYQEAGRAGRDGENARCILLFNGQDIVTNKFLINESRNLNYIKTSMEKLSVIINYCNTSNCLRHFILNYFGEESEEHCSNCSNCIDEIEKIDVTVDSQKILSCIYRVNQMYGMTSIIDCLKGNYNLNVKNKKLNKLSTYGIMKNDPKEYIRDLIGHLVADGYIHVSNSEYPILKLTNKSKEVSFESKKVLINKKNKKEKSKKIIEDNFDINLFEKLKNLRLNLSKSRKVAPYIIFSDATLKDMSKKKPVNEDEFLKVSGVGEKKLSMYGEFFLEEIINYKTSEKFSN